MNIIVNSLLRLVVLTAVGLGPAQAQDTSVSHVGLATGGLTAGIQNDTTEADWSFSASAFAYFVPEDRNYVQPTVTADRGSLHLEARYNYEAQETGSVWLGINYSGGEKLAWEFTPMMGGVFGASDGIAPGLKGSLGWWRLELAVEGEYVLDMGDAEGSFLYLWSELSLAPVDWFRFGIVSQRTRAYESELDIQRGVLAGFTYKAFDLCAYVFNPDQDEPTVVVALAVGF